MTINLNNKRLNLNNKRLAAILAINFTFDVAIGILIGFFLFT